MLKYILSVLFLFFFHISFAQNEKKLSLAELKVLDAYDETFLHDARVSVMESDSCTSLVDSMVVGNGFFAIVPRRETYVLKVVCKGYPVTYKKIQIPPKTAGKYNIQTPIYIFQTLDRKLDEVNVTASRILMVVKGDTLEYNASSFRMAKGSMLDNLVRVLPGVNIDDNGRITVNGEFVSSLLVNGRDFFHGDPRVALSNLPAYTVSKIRTYHKSEKAELRGQSKLTESEKKEAPLVMDVSLKREYAQGWISNYEAGGGININGSGEGKWLGRLFAMRYTNHSSLALFAGSNNLNDAMNVSGKGEWKKNNITDGEFKTNMGGVSFALDPKDIPLKFSTELRVQQQRHIGEMREDRTDYYTDIVTNRKNLSKSSSSNTNFNWYANVLWTPKSYYIKFEP